MTLLGKGEDPCCPLCGDDRATLLGRLGRKVWVRCRACGTTYDISESALEAEENNEEHESPV